MARPQLSPADELIPCPFCELCQDEECFACADTGLFDPHPSDKDWAMAHVIWGQCNDDRVCQISVEELVAIFDEDALPSLLWMQWVGLLGREGEQLFRFIGTLTCKDHPEGCPKNPELWHLVRSERQDRLRRMPYPDYLRTMHWDFVRLDALRRAGNRCQLCNREGELHTHHRTYERRGRELPEDVIVLCKLCHQLFHKHRSVG